MNKESQPQLGKLGTAMLFGSLAIVVLGLGLKAKHAFFDEAKLDGIDSECYQAVVSDSAALRQGDGTYLFRRADYVYGPIAYELINRRQYSVVAARKIDDWCLAQLELDGTVNGNSYRGDVLVYSSVLNQ
ncbi:hypothetical protein LQ772_04655 [Frateuria edaphi]|uniref:hypothetical protein n=1 Tax=Frateuria edaphi TaxID=2898793 RepID=UPI001E4BDC74|nr:hypothetical protein [Frateuria edaphi]UGB46591.1 hypothetical protein LQ772_04655 [Frateuria edaphi]